MRHQVQSIVLSSRHRISGTNTNFTVAIPQTGATGLSLGSVSLSSCMYTNMLANVPEPFNRYWWQETDGGPAQSFSIPPGHYTRDTLVAQMIEDSPQTAACTILDSADGTILLSHSGAGARALSVVGAKRALDAERPRPDSVCSLNELLGLPTSDSDTLAVGDFGNDTWAYRTTPNLTGQKYMLLCCHETSPGRGYVAGLAAPISLTAAIPITCAYGETGMYEPNETGTTTTILDHTSSPRMLTFQLLNEFGVELSMPPNADVIVNLTFIYQGDN